MTLAINRINIHAPYPVEVEGDTAVRFITDYGIEYSVGFAEDYSFMEDGVYQFYISNMTHAPPPNDVKVRLTIEAIIEEFFFQEPAVMLYICDTMDSRQAVRDRLFRHWFEEYVNRNQFHMKNASVEFDEVSYFATILLRCDHPNFINITNSFDRFIAELPDKIAELQV